MTTAVQPQGQGMWKVGMEEIWRLSYGGELGVYTKITPSCALLTMALAHGEVLRALFKGATVFPVEERE